MPVEKGLIVAICVPRRCRPPCVTIHLNTMTRLEKPAIFSIASLLFDGAYRGRASLGLRGCAIAFSEAISGISRRLEREVEGREPRASEAGLKAPIHSNRPG